MSRNALRDTVTLCCPLSEDEQDFAATMMQMTGITSEANLVRLGLWHLAKHLDVPVGNSIFGVRTTRGNAGQFGRGKNRVTAKQLTLDELAPEAV